MSESPLHLEDEESRSESSEMVRALEAHYAAQSPLTLGKLRASLEAIAALCIDREPDLSSLTRVVRELGLEHLPVSSIEALVDACSGHKPDDVAGYFTLKKLEELLVLVDHP